MIVALIVILFVLMTFSEIGLVALIVLPMTAVAVTGLFSFFAMLGGVNGAGEVFLWCAAIMAVFFGVISLMSHGR